MGEGEAANSPGCSGRRASVDRAGGCTLGGVDEHLRVEDEPLRDTQVVSITLTPMLQWDKDAQPIKSREAVCVVHGVRFPEQIVRGEVARDKFPCPSSIPLVL